MHRSFVPICRMGNVEIKNVSPPTRVALTETWLTVAEELDVNVGTQPDVERQVPTDVVRIVVNHNLVTVPEPVVAVADVSGSNTEIETAEPEAAGPSSRQMPNVAAANSAREAPMLPRVIEVVAGVPGTGIVSDPFAVGVNVRGIGVPGRVVEMLRLSRGSRMRLNMCLGRAMGRDMSTRRAPVFFRMLCPSGN